MNIKRFYKRFTLSRNTFDGYSTSPATVGVYKGFVQPGSGGTSTENLKLDERVEAVLYTGLSTPCKYGDIVTQDGVDYKVVYSLQPTGISGVRHHKEVLLTTDGGQTSG